MLQQVSITNNSSVPPHSLNVLHPLIPYNRYFFPEPCDNALEGRDGRSDGVEFVGRTGPVPGFGVALGDFELYALSCGSEEYGSLG
jgi:hypothetical protein